MPPRRPAAGRLDRQPENVNPLQENKFCLRVLKLPNVEFWTQNANLPAISSTPIARENIFNKVWHGPTKLDYAQFEITFQVDEDLKNYQEIHDWITGVTAPESFKQHEDFLQENRLVAPRGKIPPATIYSDARLLIYKSSSTKNIEVVFEDMFPISLSGLTFTTESVSVDELKATAIFVYRQYRLEV